MHAYLRDRWEIDGEWEACRPDEPDEASMHAYRVVDRRLDAVGGGPLASGRGAVDDMSDGGALSFLRLKAWRQKRWF